MKRIAVAIAAVALLAVGTQTASANFPPAYPFFPFGFYQPYGAQYGSSIPRPPYFATNPPVYYGARHARPYGMSPFASPPMAQAGPGYRGRLATDFYLPPSEYNTPASCVSPNPCVTHSASVKVPRKVGEVRSNPFVSEAKLASKDGALSTKAN
jgi:hypothetical protein